jgi:hypothetical protein
MTETVKCESGNEYEWTQPPRHVHWKHGRIARTFNQRSAEFFDGGDLPQEEKARRYEEQGIAMLEALTDDERARLEAYIDDVLRCGLGSGVDVRQIPGGDYFELFARSVYGVKTQKVATEEGTTDVESVDNFSDEPALPGLREDVPDVLAGGVEAHGVEVIAAG